MMNKFLGKEFILEKIFIYIDMKHPKTIKYKTIKDKTIRE